LQSRIEQAGLEVDRMTYCNTTLFPVVALMRLGQRALRSFRKNLSDEVNSDLHGYPGPVNEVLYRLMLLETKLLRRVDMPVGVSILAIARRPGTDVIENVEQNVIESAEAVLSIR
jgi:hypothetical protein